MLPYVLPIIREQVKIAYNVENCHHVVQICLGVYKIYEKKKHALLMIKCSILFTYIVLLPYIVLF